MFVLRKTQNFSPLNSSSSVKCVCVGGGHSMALPSQFSLQIPFSFWNHRAPGNTWKSCDPYSDSFTGGIWTFLFEVIERHGDRCVQRGAMGLLTASEAQEGQGFEDDRHILPGMAGAGPEAGTFESEWLLAQLFSRLAGLLL